MIVCEQQPHWAPRMRKWSSDPVEEVRSLTQLRRAVETAGGGLIAVQVGETNLLACLTTISTLQAQYPVGAVALVDRELRGLAAELHEFGFDVLVFSDLDLRKVATLQRRVASWGRARSPAGRSLRQHIWARIPWKRHARPVATSRQNETIG